MARTTAKQVLDRVDALLPNGYARAEKLRWLCLLYTSDAADEL